VDEPRPRLILVRHGETEWARLGRHTGRTDVALTEHGSEQARALGDRLAGRTFARVLSSPLKRALDTARLAGFGSQVEVDPDLAEWDYGEVEGRTTAELREEGEPAWTIWTHGTRQGESADQVGVRVDRVVARVSRISGDVAVFGHGHLLRVLAARWLGLAPSEGRHFALSTATISILGWERESRVIEVWNEGGEAGL
jgi:probable phosphoglycerate mutase